MKAFCRPAAVSVLELASGSQQCMDIVLQRYIIAIMRLSLPSVESLVEREYYVEDRTPPNTC